MRKKSLSLFVAMAFLLSQYLWLRVLIAILLEQYLERDVHERCYKAQTVGTVIHRTLLARSVLTLNRKIRQFSGLIIQNLYILVYLVKMVLTGLVTFRV
jgi:hypothetical protein